MNWTKMAPCIQFVLVFLLKQVGVVRQMEKAALRDKSSAPFERAVTELYTKATVNTHACMKRRRVQNVLVLFLVFDALFA